MFTYSSWLSSGRTGFFLSTLFTGTTLSLHKELCVLKCLILSIDFLVVLMKTLTLSCFGYTTFCCVTRQLVAVFNVISVNMKAQPWCKLFLDDSVFFGMNKGNIQSNLEKLNCYWLKVYLTKQTNKQTILYFEGDCRFLKSYKSNWIQSTVWASESWRVDET